MKQQATCRFRNSHKPNKNSVNSNNNNNNNNMNDEKKTDENNSNTHHGIDILRSTTNPCIISSPASSPCSCDDNYYEYSSARRRRRRKQTTSSSTNFFKTFLRDNDDCSDLEAKQFQTSKRVFSLTLLASLAIAWAIITMTTSSSRQTPRSPYLPTSSSSYDPAAFENVQQQSKMIMDSDTLIKPPQEDAPNLQPALQQQQQQRQKRQPTADAIVVGSGLAGMTAALTILDRGGRVVLLEKESKVGGNSVKASSGINACCLLDDDEKTDIDDDHHQQQPAAASTSATDAAAIDNFVLMRTTADTLELFQRDTTKSAGRLARIPLIETLTNSSAEAVEWLRQRVRIDLSLRAQLGGHSAKRTFRPQQGMVAMDAYRAPAAGADRPRLRVLTNTKVTRLLKDRAGNRVVGVAYTTTANTNEQQGREDAAIFSTSTAPNELYAPHVILATGGFAADRSNGSFLEQYRPDLLNMSTTAGSFSTGDGVRLASVPDIGARLVDMDQVQVHPTGFVDPANPNDSSKILAAEVMRGMGGILVNKQTGKRFCNELGTRDYVSNQMLALADPAYLRNDDPHWNRDTSIPTFALILPSSAAAACRKHIDFYAGIKHLMTRLQGVDALAKWMGAGTSNVSPATLSETLQQYRNDAGKGMDEFGKTAFRNLPGENLDDEVFYAGTVTPVLHYCMGGLAINAHGQVLKDTTNLEVQGQVIEGLFAAGETAGGVHGVNRLGGNSLLECTVFGRIIGNSIPIVNPVVAAFNTATLTRDGQQVKLAVEVAKKKKATTTTTIGNPSRIVVTRTELAQHNTPQDCWVALYGDVYDLTHFAPNHMAGPRFIYRLAGTDATEAFEAVHDRHILQDFSVQQYTIGAMLKDEDDEDKEDAKELRIVTKAELQKHRTADDCWVAIHGFVYDLTHFAKFDHLGGPLTIHSLAGTDGTRAFDTVHSQRMLEQGGFTQYQVGKL